jgi:hypothetical protein
MAAQNSAYVQPCLFVCVLFIARRSGCMNAGLLKGIHVTFVAIFYFISFSVPYAESHRFVLTRYRVFELNAAASYKDPSPRLANLLACQETISVAPRAGTTQYPQSVQHFPISRENRCTLTFWHRSFTFKF